MPTRGSRAPGRDRRPLALHQEDSRTEATSGSRHDQGLTAAGSVRPTRLRPKRRTPAPRVPGQPYDPSTRHKCRHRAENRQLGAFGPNSLILMPRAAAPVGAVTAPSAAPACRLRPPCQLRWIGCVSILLARRAHRTCSLRLLRKVHACSTLCCATACRPRATLRARQSPGWSEVGHVYRHRNARPGRAANRRRDGSRVARCSSPTNCEVVGASPPSGPGCP
jgi:hypothetical protein